MDTTISATTSDLNKGEIKMDQATTNDGTAHATTCAEMECDECIEQDRTRIRAIDAVRYPWAKPERLEWLRDELANTLVPLFRRSKRGRFNAKDMLVVHVVSTRFDFLPYFKPVNLDSVHTEQTEHSAARLPAGHPTAAYLRSPGLNRVLVLWDGGQLAAYRLPDSEGSIGFKLLVPDPAWLIADATPTN